MAHLLRCTMRAKLMDSAVRPVVESLEQRQLLSVSLQDGILRIVGTDAAEEITVLASSRFEGKLQVNVDKTKQLFTEADVKSIYIDAKGGDDRVMIQSVTRRVTVPSEIRGGSGNDSLGAGFGKTLIDGGPGNDVIKAGNGGGTLKGGPGDDRILGGDGVDRIYGGRGHNRISTSAKAEVGKDKVFSGDGDDTVNQQFRANFPTETWTGTPTGYTPFQMRRAYGFGDLADKNYTNRGQGQAIAIVDAYHTATAKQDLAAFSKEFGLPAPGSKDFKFKQIYASGYKPTEDENWAGESLLDIEWAHAIAPRATIILVEADSPLHADVNKAIDVAVKYLNRYHKGGVVSLSLGFPENETQLSLDGTFSNAYTKNISFVAAAGDAPEPLWPSTNPNVLAVGGTALFLDEYGNRRGGPTQSTEVDAISGEPTYWWDSEAYTTGAPNHQVPGGERWWNLGGGGPSAYYPEPTYQQNRLVNYYTVIGQTTYMRGAADLAWDAHPAPGFGGISVFNTAGSAGYAGWFAYGGTSCGAPQVAAMVALANQVRAENKLGKIGNTLLERIYKLGMRGTDQYFNDISRWQNPVTALQDPTPISSPIPYWVYGGWDYATGWGSPNARTLIPALADQKTTPRYVNKPIKISANFMTYNPAATTGSSAMTVLQVKGVGTMAGVRTMAMLPRIDRVYQQVGAGVTAGTPPEISFFGYQSAFNAGGGAGWDVFSVPGFGTRDPGPGLPVVLSRDGNTLTGVANWEIRTTTTTGQAGVTVTRGYLKFTGTIDKKGRIKGTFCSITPDGKPYTNAFQTDPLNPTAASTMVTGKFSN